LARARFSLDVYNLGTGEFIRTLETQRKGYSDLAVSPDNMSILAAQDSTIKVLDIESGALRCLLRGHDLNVTAVVVVPDGRAVSGSQDTTVKVWDLNSGQIVRTLEGHSKPVTEVILTTAGHLASMSYDCINIWDMESYSLVHALTPVSKNEAFRNIAASRENELVAATTHFGMQCFRIWDVRSGTLMRTLPVASPGAGTSKRVLVSAQGKIVTQRDQPGGAIDIVDMASGEVECTLVNAGRNRAMAWTSTGKMVTSSEAGSLKVWTVDAVPSHSAVRKHEGVVLAIASTLNGMSIVTASPRSIMAWNGQTGAFSHNISSDWIVDMAMTNGGKVVTAGYNNRVTVRDMETGHVLGGLDGPDERILSIAVTEDGTAVADYQEAVRVWNIETGQLVRTLEVARGTRSRVLSNGKMILYNARSQPRVVDVMSGKELYELECHGRCDFNRTPMRSGGISISADGHRVFALRGLTIHVWDSDTGRMVHRSDFLKGQSRWTTELTVGALTRDDVAVTIVKRLDTPDASTLCLWESISERIIASFSSESDMVTCEAGADGRTIVAGDKTGNVHFLKLILPEQSTSNDIRSVPGAVAPAPWIRNQVPP
jgi:WD40 repeat protein